MDHELDLGTYRSQLLNRLDETQRGSVCGALDPIQVYVNEQRVGLLEGLGFDSKLQVQTHTRIETVHLRSEDGVLLAGLSAPEYGFRICRVSLGSDTLELRIHNTADGGSLHAVFAPALTLWTRTWKMLAGAADMLVIRRPSAAVIPGMRAVAFAQVVLAIAVVGLVADRVTNRPASVPMPSTPVVITQADIPWAAPLAEVAKLELQLGELTKMQEKVVDTVGMQQQGMAQLQHTISKLSSTQDSVESSLLMVKQEVEKRQHALGREVERPVRASVSKSPVEAGQLEGAIHSLTADNARLSREVVGLEQDNQDLKRQLQSAGFGPDTLLARRPDGVQPPPPPQLTETAMNVPAQPFLFWVTFSEGTSEESIDKWVHEMKGHKGVMNEGWQEVSIVPPPVPPDRFLEQIRGEKIVKAARLNP